MIGGFLLSTLFLSSIRYADVERAKGLMKGYSISLVLAFLASVLMNTGQPALLYLVPGTLLPAIIAAWCHGDFQDFWTGQFKPKQNLRSRTDIWASTSEQFQMMQGQGLFYVSTPVFEWIAAPLPVSQRAYNSKRI